MGAAIGCSECVTSGLTPGVAGVSRAQVEMRKTGSGVWIAGPRTSSAWRICRSGSMELSLFSAKELGFWLYPVGSGGAFTLT